MVVQTVLLPLRGALRMRLTNGGILILPVLCIDISVLILSPRLQVIGNVKGICNILSRRGEECGLCNKKKT